jgi:two-component system nitrate/nitrite response regulator NarL
MFSGFPVASFLLIDDHEVVRVGLRLVLEEAFPGAEICDVGLLATGLERLQNMAKPDLVLLDPGLPDAGGVSGLQAIKSIYPDQPVVVVSGVADHTFIDRCLSLGALGFAPKWIGSDQIIACVQMALAGRIYRPVPGEASFRETLTPREEEIVIFCAAGLQNKEIGLRLGISDNTVRAHLAKIFKRFDLTSRADTKMLVERLGLRVDQPSAAGQALRQASP